MSLSHVLSDNRRRVYMAAKEILEKDTNYLVNDKKKAIKTPGKMNMKVSESNLISIIPLTANTTDYQMNIVDNQGPNQGNNGFLPMEKRLPLQDAFFTSSFGFFLTVLNQGFTGTVPIYPQMHFQLFTNPVPAIGGVFGINDLVALLGLWTTGHMQFAVGGDVQVPDWWLGRHACINQTQSAYAFASPNPYWDQQNFADDGYLPTDPFWIINGGNLNTFTIKYGSDFSQIWQNNPLVGTTAGAQLGIVAVWNGWQAQNASSIMNNEPQK